MSNQPQQSAGRARRWAVRALTVVGGAVAGTAAAWAVASAGASADTVIADSASPASSTPASSTPTADTIAEGMSGVTDGVAGLSGQTAGAAAQTVTNFSNSAKAEHDARSTFDISRQMIDQNAASKAKAAIKSFADRSVVSPTHQALSTVETMVMNPAEASDALGQALNPSKDLGKSFWNILDRGTAEISKLTSGATSSAPSSSDNHAVEAVNTSAPQVHVVSDAVRGGIQPHQPAGPANEHKDFPFTPGHSPLSPVTLPAVPGGLNTGGHYDASLFGIPAGNWNVANTAVAASGLFGVRHASVEPGSQPGVTPD